MNRNSGTNSASDLPDSDEFVVLEILSDGLDGDVDMSAVGKVLSVYARVSDAAIGRRVAVRLLGKILDGGLMEAGMFEKNEFVRFQRIEDAIAAVEESWPPDRFPRLGDSPVRLVLTERGKSELRSRGMTWD